MITTSTTIVVHLHTLTCYMHLILHSMMQIPSPTTSKGHVATNFFAESAELSLQLPTKNHMPQFLQQSHTKRQKKVSLTGTSNVVVFCHHASVQIVKR